MSRVTFEISELMSMKKYPQELFYSGNLELLQRTKVSIVGSRKPTKYSRMMVERLSSKLAKCGVCVVSGGAMGIDATAHLGAKSASTIAVLPCGVDVRYPAVNKNLLVDIEKNGLLLSQFEDGFAATPWSFVVRNELVVALGSVLVVGEADIDGGTMRSIEFALAMGKEIFVLPQRLGESCGTNRLLKDKKAEAIYDIDAFVARFCNYGAVMEKKEDEFLLFCATNPTYDEAVARFPQKVFEAELGGDIMVVNGTIRLA